MTAPLEQLASYGVPGVLLVIALLAIRSLHLEHRAERAKLDLEHKAERAAILAELAEERAARIQDAKDGTSLLLTVQKEMLAAIDKLTDLYAMVQEERREEKARGAVR